MAGVMVISAYHIKKMGLSPKPLIERETCCVL